MHSLERTGNLWSFFSRKENKGMLLRVDEE